MQQFQVIFQQLNLSDWGRFMENKQFSKFNTERDYIASKLFIPQPPKTGQVWTNLNIAVLPDYLQYIKRQLDKQEQLILSEYHLQTFLIEIAMKPHPRSNIDDCTTKIIEHIRNHEAFWMKKKNEDDCKLKAVNGQYIKDINKLKECYEEIIPKFPEKAYKLKHQKIIPNDFKIPKLTLQPNTVKIYVNSSVLPYIIDFVLRRQTNSMKPSALKDIYREIIEEMLIGIRNKPKNMLGINEKGVIASEQVRNAKIRGENIINQFSQFLGELNIQIKSLNSAKQYVMTINLINILQDIDNHFEVSQKQNVNVSKEIMQQKGKQMKVNQITVLKSDLCNKIFTEVQYQQLSSFLRKIYQDNFEDILQLRKEREEAEQRAQNEWMGFFSGQQEIEKIKWQFEQMLQHPQNTQQSKYRVHGTQVPWNETDYKNFLINFLQFYIVPTNNRKIAEAMTMISAEKVKNVPEQQNQINKTAKIIEPSHVKHIKGIYCRNMNQRIDNGEIGGGKKGILDSKIQFLKRDIENFNMKWFRKEGTKSKRKEKLKKNKKLKRRRRFNLNEQEDYDSDY